MLNETTNTAQLQINRPLFFKIILIIGFVGSVISIIQNCNNYFKSDTEVIKIQAGNEKTQLKNIFSFNKSEANKPMVISNLTPDNYEKFCIGGVVASLLCLIGTILMWLLIKSGFYSFSLGTFFNLITHFLLFGENIGAMGLSLLWALSGLILTILYSRFLNKME